jgi:hypothetical protein
MKRRKILFSEFASGFFATAVLAAFLLKDGMQIPTGAIFVLAGCALILVVFSAANRKKMREIAKQREEIENAKNVIAEESGENDPALRDKYYWR